MKIVFAIGVVTLIGLLGYLAYVQNTSQNKKIKTLNSSVVELQGQVKELQKQVNNNVSFGTQQSLDALIHQIESEIDNQVDTGNTEPVQENSQVQQSGGMLMDEQENNVEMDVMSSMENDELYQELESELTNAFANDTMEASASATAHVSMTADTSEVEDTSNIELVEEDVTEEPVSLIDNELDYSEDEDDEEDEEDEDDEEDEEDEDDEDEDEDDEEVDEESEIGEDNVKELKTEVEDDFMEKLNDFYLGKTQAELRTLCRKHKKPFSGNKQTLVSRILEVDKLRNVTLE